MGGGGRPGLTIKAAVQLPGKGNAGTIVLYPIDPTDLEAAVKYFAEDATSDVYTVQFLPAPPEHHSSGDDQQASG